jgi:hypothetical protein
VHDFVRLGRVGVVRKRGLILVGCRKDAQQFFQRSEIGVFLGCRNHGFDAMVARNEGGIVPSHPRRPLGGTLRFARQPFAPFHRPLLERQRVFEQRVHGAVGLVAVFGSVTEPAEQQGEVHLVGRHALEQIPGQCDIAFLRVDDADLAQKSSE